MKFEDVRYCAAKTDNICSLALNWERYDTDVYGDVIELMKKGGTHPLVTQSVK